MFLYIKYIVTSPKICIKRLPTKVEHMLEKIIVVHPLKLVLVLSHGTAVLEVKGGSMVKNWDFKAEKNRNNCKKIKYVSIFTLCNVALPLTC